MTQRYHEPVLLEEVCQLLQPRPGDTIVDCNLGTGGHSLALWQRVEGEGFLVGIDLDLEMLSIALQRFREHAVPDHAHALVHANHSDLARVLGDLGRTHADRIVIDPGASSLHFDMAERGFAFQADGPLDMRYERTAETPTAAQVVNEWPEKDLARLFFDRGGERWARRIASELVRRRRKELFRSTAQLAEAVAGAIPRKAWPPRIHPATRVFLALRAEVNAEMESLEKAINAALDVLSPGGRLAVLTFQSHEDRLVKHRFRAVTQAVADPTDPWGRPREPVRFRDLTRKPIGPKAEEIERNPRARSAKLRGVEKLERLEAPPNR